MKKIIALTLALGSIGSAYAVNGAAGVAVVAGNPTTYVSPVAVMTGAAASVSYVTGTGSTGTTGTTASLSAQKFTGANDISTNELTVTYKNQQTGATTNTVVVKAANYATTADDGVTKGFTADSINQFRSDVIAAANSAVGSLTGWVVSSVNYVNSEITSFNTKTYSDPTKYGTQALAAANDAEAAKIVSDVSNLKASMTPVSTTMTQLSRLTFASTDTATCGTTGHAACVAYTSAIDTAVNGVTTTLYRGANNYISSVSSGNGVATFATNTDTSSDLNIFEFQYLE